ncbi:nucleotidyltransferase family protein [Thermomonas sp.]|uniref:nucleotidyltransferase family protein n=1 Tax=Thermomonas sp. TaxID=1971895 RepID=UPI0035B31D29
MNTAEIGEILRTWAAAKPLVNRVWIFGSRARGEERPDSDLDVAVELDMTAADGVDESGGFATWSFETTEWHAELSALLPFEIDLEQYREPDTPTIHQALARSSKLVYAKAGPNNSSKPTPLRGAA